MRLIDADAFKEYLKNAFEEVKHVYTDGGVFAWRITEDFCRDIDEQPTINAEPERLTDDDFETIRIHLNAQKEKLCNQQRWEEAEEYQRIIDRFMAFASAQPERKKGKWIDKGHDNIYQCSACGDMWMGIGGYRYCPTCGAMMRGDEDE